jgi:hypothetical protein
MRLRVDIISMDESVNYVPKGKGIIKVILQIVVVQKLFHQHLNQYLMICSHGGDRNRVLMQRRIIMKIII